MKAGGGEDHSASLQAVQQAAEKAIEKRVKPLVVAGTLGKQTVTTQKGAISMKARVQMMKEDITREATMRMMRLHESEEVWALDLALDRLGPAGDVQPSREAIDACREILLERRRLLERRMQVPERRPPANPRPKKDERDAPGSLAEVLPERQVPRPLRDSGSGHEVLDPEYWSRLLGLEVSSAAAALDSALDAPLWQGCPSLPPQLSAEQWGTSLTNEGWAATGILGEECARAAERLHAAALRLREAGWPPAFVFMSDEAWRLIAQVQQACQRLLAPLAEGQWEWRLEPSFAAFLLDEGHKSGSGKRLGNSFPLPHRDHSYSACFDSDGNPKLVSVWVPLTDVDVDSGCMYVVPKEFDPAFDSDAAYHHMQLISEAQHDVDSELADAAAEDGGSTFSLTSTTVCGFPLAGTRPLPCPRGSFLAWNSNLAHWGSFCHTGALQPRASLALVVRRCSPRGPEGIESPQLCDPAAQPIDLAEASVRASLITVRRRLLYVMAALRYFEHWYDASSVKDQVMSALRSAEVAASSN